jgi:hypothetical protein
MTPVTVDRDRRHKVGTQRALMWARHRLFAGFAKRARELSRSHAEESKNGTLGTTTLLVSVQPRL